MEFQNYRDCRYTCNPHKFEIPALRFPHRVPVIPCKHLQCSMYCIFLKLLPYPYTIFLFRSTPGCQKEELHFFKNVKINCDLTKIFQHLPTFQRKSCSAGAVLKKKLFYKLAGFSELPSWLIPSWPWERCLWMDLLRWPFYGCTTLDNKIAHWKFVSKIVRKLEMVFCYQNCSDLLWEKIYREKNLENSRLTKLKNVSEYWKVRTIFETEYIIFYLINGYHQIEIIWI